MGSAPGQTVCAPPCAPNFDAFGPHAAGMRRIGHSGQPNPGSGPNRHPLGHQVTRGKTFTFTLTPSATILNTSGVPTLTGTLPIGQNISTISGIGWDCSASAGVTINCTTTSVIAAESNGYAVTVNVRPDRVNSGFVQQFTLTGGGAASATTAMANSVIVNPPPSPRISLPYTLKPVNVATSFTPVTRIIGGTSPFTWSVDKTLPSNLLLDPDTGAVYGTLSTATLPADYTITVTDARGVTSSQTVTIGVTDIPTICSLTPTLGPSPAATLSRLAAGICLAALS